MTIPFPVAYRERVASDDAFIVTTWLESLHKGNDSMRRLRFSRYKRQLVPIVAAAIQSGTCIVAAIPDDPDHIIGWSCATESMGVRCLQYAFVRQDRRGVGLGDALMRLAMAGATDGEYAYVTDSGRRAVLALGLHYNPLSMVVR